MSGLIFTDYGDRRKRERRAPQQKKIQRKRKEFDETQGTPEARVGRRLIEVMKEVTDISERDRYALRDRLLNKSGFGHMNAEMLVAMILFLQKTAFKKPELTNFNPKILDPIIEKVLSNVDYNTLTEYARNNLYATVFRYVNWYFESDTENIEEGFEEGLEEESLEELLEEEEEEELLEPGKGALETGIGR